MYKLCTFAPADGQTSPAALTNMIADYCLIKLARFNQGLSQMDLAKKAGLSHKTIVKAERGKSIGSKSNKAIRDALGLE